MGCSSPNARHPCILINLLYESESLKFELRYKDLISSSYYCCFLLLSWIKTYATKDGIVIVITVKIKVLLIVVRLKFLNLQLEIYKKDQKLRWQENKNMAFQFVMWF